MVVRLVKRTSLFLRSAQMNTHFLSKSVAQDILVVIFCQQMDNDKSRNKIIVSYTILKFSWYGAIQWVLVQLVQDLQYLHVNLT